MGVYIKGIGIPTDNTVLIRVFPVSENGECYVQQLDVDGDILDELWAVPVPAHGRLIDADALHEELYALEYARENEWLDGVREARGVDAARVALLDAPTIIPAEEN